MGAQWFVTGATGRLGTAMRGLLEQSGAEVIATPLNGRDGTVAVDLERSGAVTRALTRAMPEYVMHLGGITRPIEVARHPDNAYRANVTATRAIAQWCAEHRRPMLFTSTDQVFCGPGAPFGEARLPRPTTLYGRMKREGERAVLAAGGLAARCGWLINDYPGAAPDMLTIAVQHLREGRPFHAVDDEWRTPIGTTEAAASLIRLAVTGATGIVHVAGDHHCRPIDLVRREASRLGLPGELIRPISRTMLGPEGRPADVRLDTARMNDLLRRQGHDAVLAA